MSQPFAARLFESRYIKSWVQADAPALRAALSRAVDTLANGSSLVFDVLVDVQAPAVEPRLAGAEVALWRSRPSNSFGARVRRTMGFYSGESRLAAAVVVGSGEMVSALLPDTALWDSEFALYPRPSQPLGQLPDPHFELSGFASHAQWSVSQDATHESWLVTGSTQAEVERVCAVLVQAFGALGLNSTTALAPAAVYG
jgi:hypothetical protein